MWNSPLVIDCPNEPACPDTLNLRPEETFSPLALSKQKKPAFNIYCIQNLPYGWTFQILKNTFQLWKISLWIIAHVLRAIEIYTSSALQLSRYLTIDDFKCITSIALGVRRLYRFTPRFRAKWYFVQSLRTCPDYIPRLKPSGCEQFPSISHCPTYWKHVHLYWTSGYDKTCILLNQCEVFGSQTIAQQFHATLCGLSATMLTAQNMIWTAKNSIGWM